MVLLDKKEIRMALLQKRKNYDPNSRIQASKFIQDICYETIKNYACIGIYVSDPYEVVTHDLIKRLLPNHRVCCPLIYNNGIMDFFEIKNFDDLVVQSCGLLEPKTKLLIQPSEIDAMVLPLVAYNKEGYRIGQGKGYYDRYLEDYQGLKIGLAFSFQKASFTWDKYDIPCHRIITNEPI